MATLSPNSSLARIMKAQFNASKPQGSDSSKPVTPIMQVTNGVTLARKDVTRDTMPPTVPKIAQPSNTFATLLGLNQKVREAAKAEEAVVSELAKIQIPVAQPILLPAESTESLDAEYEARLAQVQSEGWDEFDESDDSDEVEDYAAASDNSEEQTDAIPDIMEGVKITPDESQLAAVRGLARVPAGCLIGAAGTGKTTTTRLLLDMLMNGSAVDEIEPLRFSRIDLNQYHTQTDESDPDAKKRAKVIIPTIAFVAFTGQATQVLKKNLPKAWARNVMTIHSLLGYAPVDFIREDGSTGMRFEPSFTKENKMPWKVIMIDEASMVDVNLWHQMLDASEPGTRFYFIGDLNQLPPPIGQGILGFALAKLPTFELTHVHRQADDAANKIVDTAWNILQGIPPEFDDTLTNHNWRVAGFKLEHTSAKAHNQIISMAKALSTRTIHPSVDPTEPPIYDPWRDRIMTQMNGFNDADPTSLLGQFPLNESLSRVFADPDQPRVVIDAQRSIKRFAVGYRVMATKNEAPDVADRVTNGMTGKITGISANPKWAGDRRLVGNEADVTAARAIMLESSMAHRQVPSLDEVARATDSISDFKLTAGDHTSVKEDRTGGPASHVVQVLFDNGASRSYNMNAQVDQLMIAYASTTHKAQGAEMPTAIIVVHHGLKRMLTRENLYTAVTRASQRVILLYTDFGMRIALANQTISGKTLPEKVKQYKKLLGEGDPNGFQMMTVRFPTVRGEITVSTED